MDRKSGGEDAIRETIKSRGEEVGEERARLESNESGIEEEIGATDQGKNTSMSRKGER